MSMSMELHSKIYEYVSHKISLQELESWIVPRLPYFISQTDSSVEELASAVELCLAELQAGLRSQRSIRAFLARQLGDNPIIWAAVDESQAQDTTGSATSSHPTWMAHWVDPSPTWSIAPQVANV